MGVSTLLSVIREDATKVLTRFSGEKVHENEVEVNQVLAECDAYCEPRTKVIYERYRLNNRKQETDENIAAYLLVTELRTVAKNCKHEEITRDEIIVLGQTTRSDKDFSDAKAN